MSEGPIHYRLSLSQQLTVMPGCRLAAALFGGLAVVDVTRIAGTPAGLQAMLLAALACACCLRQSLLTALAVTVTVWLVATGFVVNEYGLISLTGAADAVRLVAFATAALLGTRVR
jgi:hypothetical protein